MSSPSEVFLWKYPQSGKGQWFLLPQHIENIPPDSPTLFAPIFCSLSKLLVVIWCSNKVSFIPGPEPGLFSGPVFRLWRDMASRDGQSSDSKQEPVSQHKGTGSRSGSTRRSRGPECPPQKTRLSWPSRQPCRAQPSHWNTLILCPSSKAYGESSWQVQERGTPDRRPGQVCGH